MDLLVVKITSETIKYSSEVFLFAIVRITISKKGVFISNVEAITC
ncbi:MAG: hypothetical protein Q3983_07270 [Capnocytophaga sp.]|nr:hypothetical protein [Capnocytophaga sp.]